jgi:potassium-transporting ATPase KdpC subunit
MKRFLSIYLRPAIVMTLLLTVLTGLIYPGIVTAFAQLLFPSQANGSLVYVNGKLVGSELIGQYWTSSRYFHGRPSATLSNNGHQLQPYNAENSGASNLGPTNAKLVQILQQRITEVRQENPAAPPGPVPIDLVTASDSGLDPDISLAAALYQVPRIAKARGISQATLTNMVTNHVQGRFLGIFGEPYINVLELNLALDTFRQEHTISACSHPTARPGESAVFGVASDTCSDLRAMAEKRAEKHLMGPYAEALSGVDQHRAWKAVLSIF